MLWKMRLVYVAILALVAVAAVAGSADGFYW
jgi:hypothetical protein